MDKGGWGKCTLCGHSTHTVVQFFCNFEEPYHSSKK